MKRLSLYFVMLIMATLSCDTKKEDGLHTSDFVDEIYTGVVRYHVSECSGSGGPWVLTYKRLKDTSAQPDSAMTISLPSIAKAAGTTIQFKMSINEENGVICKAIRKYPPLITISEVIRK